MGITEDKVSCSKTQQSASSEARARDSISSQAFYHSSGLLEISQEPGPKVIKLFSCSPQMSMEIQLLIMT